MRIIPAIDIIEGKCVRLSQGDYTQKKIYNENPLEVAKAFEDAGAAYLHLVDLDGAKSKHVVNWKILAQIASETSLKVDFGGGIKTEDDLKLAFENGAEQVNCGSIAVRDQALVISWLEKFGSDKIILGADVRNQLVSIEGWQENTGLDIFHFVESFQKQGLEYVTCTDIASDGMLKGPNVKLYHQLKNRFPYLKVIASGGIASTRDVERLKALDLDGVIIGKAIYEGKIDLFAINEL